MTSFRYPTRTVTLPYDGFDISLTYITDVDQLLDELIAKGETHEDYVDQRIPYWADLWHAALGLSQYLMKQEVIRPGMSVLEIGCGLGLPGLVAAKLGAKVCFSDYVPEPLEFLGHNWTQNCQGELHTQQMDWRAPQADSAADLLLASDVAYEKRSFEALIQAMDQLIPPGGRAILTEPSREMAKPFLKRLETLAGYTVRTSTERVYWNDFWKTVNVVDLHRTTATH